MMFVSQFNPLKQKLSCWPSMNFFLWRFSAFLFVVFGEGMGEFFLIVTLLMNAVILVKTGVKNE